MIVASKGMNVIRPSSCNTSQTVVYKMTTSMILKSISSSSTQCYYLSTTIPTTNSSSLKIQQSSSYSKPILSKNYNNSHHCHQLLLFPFTIGSKRYKASSTAIFSGFIPNAVKEAVKTSLLDEVSKPDSKLWSHGNNNNNNINNNHNHKSSMFMNGQMKKSQSICSTNTTTNNNMNHNQYSPQEVINNPISSTRLAMLNDPLDEWHLSSKPGSILDTTNANNINPLYSPSEIHPQLTELNDPFILSKDDIQSLSINIRRDLIGKDHPVLTQVAAYFFEDGKDGGKKIRPMMVLLLSRAMATSTAAAAATHSSSSSSPSSSTPLHLVNGNNDNNNSNHDDYLFSSQKRLAEISEMIHTASLFHDDVIDKAETRRGSPAVHQVFGNKMAILAGDYLLARASVFLARLRDVEVVETMSTIIEHLVRGEVMQMKGSNSDNDNVEERLVHYLRKNFYKTASLMANSCKSAAILGNYDDTIIEGAYKYGKHLGIAFQLVDDVLDFDGKASSMGKAALADLNAGLATAPVLFAAEQFPNEIQPMMDRKFRNEGDVDRTVHYVRQTDGIQRTKDLAQVHVELAIESILKSLQPSVYRDALVHLAHKVVDRTR